MAWKGKERRNKHHGPLAKGRRAESGARHFKMRWGASIERALSRNGQRQYLVPTRTTIALNYREEWKRHNQPGADKAPESQVPH